ncbi:type IV pilus modification protein PilV [Rhodanobacter ginsengisoli]|uniref:Type IV pilus modification protein PilV n=1 Tax=Rhodanobacter ginsengisoli TaxID=418646 RepID=A0ABW0QSA8_9GAMM
MNGLDPTALPVSAGLVGAPDRLVGRAAASRVRSNYLTAITVPRRQSGVGLIEVLVAVLVVSIGFLGIAALQAMSMSTNNSAMARSMATVASYSILDAMRADINSAKHGDYNGTVTPATAAVPAVGGTAAIPANSAACPAAGTTLAAYQLSQWCGQLSTSLGSSTNTTGTISCDANGQCTVTIVFDDSRAGLGGGTQQKVITKGML